MIEENNYEIVKFIDGEFELDVNISPKEETIWLTQSQMALLFDVDRTRITRHIKNIFYEVELVEESNVRKKHFPNSDKLVALYSLNVVISVGYRVKSKRGVLFRIWANQVLKEYLLRGYVINDNRVTISNENYIELKNEVTSINNRLIDVENKIKTHEIPLDKIFFNGEFYDAYTLIEQIFESANEEIILMDSYVDRIVLDRLTKKKQNVNVIIYTKYNSKRITQNDINAVNIQYPNISLIEVTTLHDRYIIIDKIKLYHVGASIKDAGRKTFSIHEIDNQLINTLLEGVN